MTTYIKPPHSEECKWRRDKPKEPGWYPASYHQCPEVLRYWDGRHWSQGAIDKRDADFAARSAKQTDPIQHDIEWCEPWWPENKGKA